MTPVAEYSSVVNPEAQGSSNASGVSALNSFLGALSGLAAPVAQIVQATQAPKYGNTSNTGDGQKAPTPVSTTPGAVPVSGINKQTLIYAGLGIVAVIAIVAVLRKQ
jgi:hypothetical protein